MFYLSSSREGNGTPLQYSCLENPMDRGDWKAAAHGVAEGRTRLSEFTFTFMHWRRKWQPTPVFLPGESQGRGSLVGCTESDTTEATQQQQQAAYVDRMTLGRQLGSVPGGFQRKGKVCLHDSFSKLRVAHSGLDRTAAVPASAASTC